MKKAPGAAMEDQFLDVIMDDLESHPHCPHGPTLLFRRVKRGEDRRFFACSACRDRKLCSFFHWADEELSQQKRQAWELERAKLVAVDDHEKLYRRLCGLKRKLDSGKHQAGYCQTCHMLLRPRDPPQHAEHDVTTGVTLHQLLHPSELLKPLQTNTKEAQFLFSRQATRVIVDAARNIGVKSFLCLGTPRVHEAVMSSGSEDLGSLLLDIDRRYHSFWSPQEFCWFNSFNSHFFLGESSRAVLDKFLQRNGGDDLLMIMDPPFGGRMEPLAHTVQEIRRLHRRLNPGVRHDMRVMFISPYFMEPHIVASFPDLHMLDYQVGYENHPLFLQGGGNKTGSPVRIFTDIPAEDVPLPEEEGYWWCAACRRWSSCDNKHCDLCGTCPSKNGRTYVHCHKCQRCVKPSWKHCDKCGRCCLAPHSCGAFEPSGACYKCGEPGHKKYECPSQGGDSEPSESKKRRLESRVRSKRCKKKRRELCHP